MGQFTEEGAQALREAITEVINSCQDIDLLDLVLKLLLHG